MIAPGVLAALFMLPCRTVPFRPAMVLLTFAWPDCISRAGPLLPRLLLPPVLLPLAMVLIPPMCRIFRGLMVAHLKYHWTTILLLA